MAKGVVICSAGNTMEYFQRTGILSALKKVMLDDRLFDRVQSKELIILDGTSRETPDRERNWNKHLDRAFQIGASIGC